MKKAIAWTRTQHALGHSETGPPTIAEQSPAKKLRTESKSDEGGAGG